MPGTKLETLYTLCRSRIASVKKGLPIQTGKGQASVYQQRSKMTKGRVIQLWGQARWTECDWADLFQVMLSPTRKQGQCQEKWVSKAYKCRPPVWGPVPLAGCTLPGEVISPKCIGFSLPNFCKSAPCSRAGLNSPSQVRGRKIKKTSSPLPGKAEVNSN